MCRAYRVSEQVRTSENNPSTQLYEQHGMLTDGVKTVRSLIRKDHTAVHQLLHQRGQEPPAHVYMQLRARFAAFPIPTTNPSLGHEQ
jgi:hypothetical protein